MARLNTALKIGLGTVFGAGLMVTVIIGAIWVSHIESNKAAANYPKCQGKHTVHTVNIQNDKVTPSHTNANRCDTLVIINLDDKPRLMAFGLHENHVAYDGVSERYLDHGGKLQVTLVQPGNFRFHDHIEGTVQGTFSVKSN